MSDILVLWDIDGTLVSMDRAGERALLQLLRETYQHDFGQKLPVALAGRTDTSIVPDLLRHVKREATPEAARRFQDEYLALLPLTMSAGKARLQPGIQAALDAIKSHPSIHQGLLTGNLREGARLKLSYLDIWRYFEFGAYADDSAIRNELGPVALARAHEKLGVAFAPENVFIIGDTEHDISCGKAIGAQTIAVATGAFNVEELAQFNPTYALKDLSDTAGLMKLLGEGRS